MGSDLPARMVEAAGNALYTGDCGRDNCGRCFGALPSDDREPYRARARAALAAGLRVLAEHGTWRPDPTELTDIADEIEGGA